MSVSIFTQGQWHSLAGKKINRNGVWIEVSAHDQMKVGAKWYPLSFEDPEVINPQPGVFPGLHGPAVTPGNIPLASSEEPTSGNVFYMTPNGAGDLSGSSWENAFPASNIYTAVQAMNSGDRLYLSEGDYGVFSSPVTLNKSIAFYGGFSLTDPAWETRDNFRKPTIFSGTGDFPFFIVENSVTCVCDGLTIQNVGDVSNEYISFANANLSNGTITLFKDLNNFIATDCRITGTGNINYVYLASTETLTVDISGNIAHATMYFTGGTLRAENIYNAYIDSCELSTNWIFDSECANSDLNVNSSRNVKCFGGSVIAEGTCFNTSSHGMTCYSAESCSVDGNLEAYSSESTTVVNGNCSKIFGKLFKTSCCGNYYISNGRLFHNGERVGDLTGWTAVSEYYGICAGTLYLLRTGSVEQISNLTGWTAISEMYGICNGKIYNTSFLEERVGGLTGWTAISEMYGICAGALYFLPSDSANPVSSLTGWTAVSNNYGICAGALYLLRSGSVEQVSDLTGWTALSENYGICAGALYSLSGSSVEQVSSLTGWTAVSNNYGICAGRLYFLEDSTAELVGGFSNWSEFADGYAVRSNILYKLSGTTATEIEKQYFAANNCTLVACAGELFLNRSFLFNGSGSVSAENSVVASSNVDIIRADFCTFANCSGNLLSGENNVLWNCSGTVADPSRNAQSAYNASNLVTLGTDNNLTFFASTGYFPNIGKQSLGKCPFPAREPGNYAAFLATFGNWKPGADSVLKAKGTSDISIDIAGTTRQSPPTLGAYEAGE